MPQIPYSPLTPTTTLQHLGCLDSNDFINIFQFLQKWLHIPLVLCTSNFKISPASGRLRPPDPLPEALPLDPTGGAKPPDPQIGSRYRARHGPPTLKPLASPLNTLTA